MEPEVSIQPYNVQNRHANCNSFIFQISFFNSYSFLFISRVILKRLSPIFASNDSWKVEATFRAVEKTVLKDSLGTDCYLQLSVPSSFFRKERIEILSNNFQLLNYFLLFSSN